MADMSLLTITCTAGEIQPVEFNGKYNTVNIYNNTDGRLLISRTPDFVNKGNIGYYLTIPSSAAYNNLFIGNKNIIYLKAEASGTVTVAVK